MYLWILQYGLPDDAILSSVTFPWIPAVSKVDNIDDMIRWRMIVDNMPLSLLIIIVGVHQKVITIITAVSVSLLLMFVIGNSGCPENYMNSFSDLRIGI